MSIFVIGSNGYISKRFINNHKGSDLQLVSCHLQNKEHYLDLGKPEAFNYNLINKNDVILLLAAISSPDTCNNNYEFAYSINVKGTIQFMNKCLEKEARVLFFSSDTVYGNNYEELDENSICNPIGKYAEMKHRVEDEFLGCENFKVFRLSYVFSKNDKFMAYLRECSKKGEQVEVFHPMYRRVVYIDDLILAIDNLCMHWTDYNYNIFNICGKDLISRLDMANAYKNLIDENLNIKVVEPPKEFFSARPKKINMSSLNFSQLLKRDPLSFNKAMKLEFFNNNK